MLGDHEADVVRLEKVLVLLGHRAYEFSLTDSRLELEQLLSEADILILKNAPACVVERLQVVLWNQFWSRLVAPHTLMLLVKAIYNGFVANTAHNRHENLEVAILATYLLLKTGLQECVKALSSDLRFAFAVQDAKKVKFVDPKRELRVLLNTLIVPIIVFIVLEDPEDVILHQQSPVKTRLIVDHSL